jgi:1,4-alpha-glucan branching enzyme
MLPVSHDEVVYGKHSLLNKMPGDTEDKFSNLRSFMAYMIAHPGKKLSFMGNELAQDKEWDFKSELDWSLLADEKHSKFHRFIKDLNRFYIDNPPLHQVDFKWEGFNWIHHDDYTKSIIAFRRIDKQGNEIIVLCNFQNLRHDKYYIGVPEFGVYSEIFSTNNEIYGGNGESNGDRIIATDFAMHGCAQSIRLTVPPMSVSFFKLTEKLEKPKPTPVEKKKTPKKVFPRKKQAVNKVSQKDTK